MAKLLCKNPEIEQTQSNSVAMYYLARKGIAKKVNFYFEVDWPAALDYANSVHGPGARSAEKIILWAKSAQHRVQSDAATPSQAGATCPHCGKPIILVAPETPRN